MPRPHKPANPFRYFNSSSEIIRMMVMMSVRFLLSLGNVEYLLFERGIDLGHETKRMWRKRFPCAPAIHPPAAGEPDEGLPAPVRVDFWVDRNAAKFLTQ